MSNVKNPVSADAPAACEIPPPVESQLERDRRVSREGMRRLRAERRLAAAMKRKAKRDAEMRRKDRELIEAAQGGRGSAISPGDAPMIVPPCHIAISSGPEPSAVPVGGNVPVVSEEAVEAIVAPRKGVLAPIQEGEVGGVVDGPGLNGRVIRVRVKGEVESAVVGKWLCKWVRGKVVGLRREGNVWCVCGKWNRFGERVG